MVACIIGAVIAEQARVATQAATGGVVVYSPGHALLRADEPVEQTNKRLDTLEQFPWSPPAGNA